MAEDKRENWQPHDWSFLMRAYRRHHAAKGKGDNWFTRPIFSFNGRTGEAKFMPDDNLAPGTKRNDDDSNAQEDHL